MFLIYHHHWFNKRSSIPSDQHMGRSLRVRPTIQTHFHGPMALFSGQVNSGCFVHTSGSYVPPNWISYARDYKSNSIHQHSSTALTIGWNHLPKSWSSTPDAVSINQPRQLSVLFLLHGLNYLTQYCTTFCLLVSNPLVDQFPSCHIFRPFHGSKTLVQFPSFVFFSTAFNSFFVPSRNLWKFTITPPLCFPC